MNGLPFTLATLLIAAMISFGCGPSLKHGETFEPKRVRELMFNDACHLQNYFKGSPPLPKLLTQQNVSTDPRFAAGEATFIIANAKNIKVFWTLIAELYTRIPELPSQTKEIEVHLRYHLLGKRTTMPIGAETRVVIGDLDFELPYHPCTGAFFYGREYYRIRAKLQP